jgi:hypothetical protein
MPPMLIPQEAPKVNYNNLNLNRNTNHIAQPIMSNEVQNVPVMPQFGNNNPIHTRQKL